MKPDDQHRYADALQQMRKDLLENARRAVRGSVHFDPDDAPDEIDSAASESGLAFIGHLRDRERTLLGKIERALRRIGDGTYGTCDECEEEIEPSRLLARPTAELCVDCKSERERVASR